LDSNSNLNARFDSNANGQFAGPCDIDNIFKEVTCFAVCVSLGCVHVFRLHGAHAQRMLIKNASTLCWDGPKQTDRVCVFIIMFYEKNISYVKDNASTGF